MVTGERDNLRNVINELKRSKNDEAGDFAASGTLVQVKDIVSPLAVLILVIILELFLVTWFGLAGA